MWFERFVIIVTSLHRDFLPSSWAMYSPTWVEAGIYVGTFGLFFTLFLLFAKYLPVIAIAEIKSVYKITRNGKPLAAVTGPEGQGYDQDLAFEIAASGQAYESLGTTPHGKEGTSADPRALGGPTGNNAEHD